MTRIVVEVNTNKTGQVVRVFCDDPNTQVVIVDFTQMTEDILQAFAQKHVLEGENRISRAVTGLTEVYDE